MENAVKTFSCFDLFFYFYFFGDGKKTMMAVTGIDPRNYESFSVHSK